MRKGPDSGQDPNRAMLPRQDSNLKYIIQSDVCCRLHHGGIPGAAYAVRRRASTTMPDHQPSMRRYKSAPFRTLITRQPR